MSEGPAFLGRGRCAFTSWGARPLQSDSSCHSQTLVTRQLAPRHLSFRVHVTDMLNGPDGLCPECSLHRVEI